MGSTLVLVHCNGQWDASNHYNNFDVVGVILNVGCNYIETKLRIAEQLKINKGVDFVLRYQLKESYPPIIIDSDASLLFYKELKEKETDYTKFPLCTSIVEQRPPQSDTLPIVAWGDPVGGIESTKAEKLRAALLRGADTQKLSFVDVANEAAELIMNEVQSVAKKVNDRLYDDDAVEADEIEGGDVHVGQMFKNEDVLKRTLKMVALTENFSFKVVKSCPVQYYVACLYDCGWFMKASIVGQSKVFKVRSMCSTHKCSLDERMSEQRQATTQVVSDCIKSKFCDLKTIYTPADIIRDMKDEYGVNLSYKKAWRSRRKAIDEIRGKPDESYQMIHRYLERLNDSNPGSVVAMKISEDLQFEFVFMSMYASIKGWEHCRPIVVVDGTFLKASYGGTLLTASVQDANAHILPIAFAIVDSENYIAYEWFFEKLRSAIGTRPGMCIVSDRNESLVKAVTKVYPEVAQCFCMYHLGNNLKKHFKKNAKVVRQTFISAATAYTIDSFDRHMSDLKNIDHRVVDYLVGIGVDQWARAHCPHNRFLSMTSNAAESVNAALRSARELPVTTLLECLRALQQKWNVVNGDEARGNFTTLTKRGQDMLEENYKLALRMTVHKANDRVYQVSAGQSTFVVDLQRNTCTCNRFQMDELPCAHALSVLRGRNEDPISYCSRYYHNQTMVATYEEAVYPVAVVSCLTKEHGANDVVLPPSGRVRAGRPNKKRKRSVGEYQRRTNCSKCGRTGHNMKTCRGRPAAQLDIV